MPTDTAPLPVGMVRCYQVKDLPPAPFRLLRPGQVPPGWHSPSPRHKNLLLYSWATIVGQLLLRQGVQYGIGGMYLEFANVASPGLTVSPPGFTRDPSQGLDYYDSLASNPTKDYLRVPLIAGVLNQSDAALFPGGNVPTFFAQTQGLIGVGGKPFDAAHNSVVYGGALVAMPVQADASQDIVMSRFYLAGASQMPKQNNSQVGLSWEITLN